MTFRGAAADLRAVSSSSIARRALFVASSAIFLRMLAPVLAWTLVERSSFDKVIVTLGFGAAFTARTLLLRVFLARTEADILQSTAASVLSGDVLRADILADEDVHFEAARGVHHVSQLLSQILPNACGDLIACALLAIGVALVEPARLVAFAGAVTLIAAGALVLSRRVVAGAVERTWSLQRAAYESFADALLGRLEIVASGRREAFMADLAERARAWSRGGVRVALSTVLSGRVALVGVAGLVVAALVANERLRGSLALTTADAALFASATPAFVGVAQGVHAFVRDQHWLRTLARVIRDGPSKERSDARPPPSLPAQIAFDRVSFSYGPRAVAEEGALSELTLDWPGTDILALSGANGSGKSTCLRILLGIARPFAGTVRVGGLALDELDPDAWRSRVAFLPQRPYLPPRADVRRAVRWPLSLAGDERIVRALARVGLLPVLRRKGGDPLEVRVDSLSVGERQRIALARLLCRDASLFLLDEPDANLDRQGIALVADVVRELAQHAMVAFAAHTPELLEVAHRIVVLKDGRLADRDP